MTLIFLVLALVLALVLGLVIGMYLKGHQKDANRTEQVDQLQQTLSEINRRQAELGGSITSFSAAQETARGEFNRTLSVRLDAISRNITQNLKESGEKTSKTLGDLGERLSIIDQAQQRITALSGQVVELQHILDNKQARGVFGEIQLENIVTDVLPESAFSLQHTLSNGKRADCLIRLPNPPGSMVVDSKFPLEAFRRLHASESDTEHKEIALAQLGKDALKHAQDIANKYILPGETADAALMFLPSESVFYELHLRLPEIVDKCRALRVYPVSPNTMSLVLNTVRAIMRDVKMREQAGLIQKEVHILLADVSRLNERVEKLRSHFDQANKDIEQIETSNRKICSRGEKITSLELLEEGEEQNLLSE